VKLYHWLIGSFIDPVQWSHLQELKGPRSLELRIWHYLKT